MPRLTAATFNTHFGVRPRHQGGGRFDVVDAIARLDADVVALEEVWQPHGGRSFAVAAAERLGYHLEETAVAPGVISPAKPDVVTEVGESEGWWGIALLSRWPMRRRDLIDLGRILTDPVHRVSMPVEVDVPDGPPVLFSVAHISHRLFGSPRQIRHLHAHLPASGRPAVALGDFNMWGPVVARLFPGWRRAVVGRTWPAHRPHSQIDHLLVNAAVRVVSGEVLPNQGSDHRPIRAVLEV